MKYLLLLLLLASILTIDSPVTNDIRFKLMGYISNLAHSEYSENRITTNVSKEIESLFNTLNEEEEAAIVPFLHSPKKLLKFYRDYCEHDGFYSELSNLNRRKICGIIDRQFDAIDAEALRKN